MAEQSKHKGGHRAEHGSARQTASAEGTATATANLHPVICACLNSMLASTAGEAAALYLPPVPPTDTLWRLYAQQGLADHELTVMQTLTFPQPFNPATLSPSDLTEPTRANLPSPQLPEVLTQAFAGHLTLPVPLNSTGYALLWVGSRTVKEFSPSAAAAWSTLLQPMGQLLPRAELLPSAGQNVEPAFIRWANNLDDCALSFYLLPEKRVAFLSEGFTGLTGYPREKLLENLNFLFDITHPDDQWIWQQDHERVISGRNSRFYNRTRLLHADGLIKWIHTRGRVEHDEQGLRVDALICDVTDHVKLEEQIRRTDRLSAVEMLAGGIAHEYNNLHFAIIGTLDLLLMRDDLETTVRQYVDRVRKAAERASEITNKLVSFAKGGSGTREMLNVVELTDSTLSIVRREFATQGIELVIEPPPQPLFINGNRAELGQVIISLAINAQQAMDDSPHKKLTVSFGHREGQIFISFTDTGHGISWENLSRLFDPFFTTKGAAGSWLKDRPSTDAELPGRGLGLSVVQSLIREHGGDIEVSSKVGIGTTFTLWLPPVVDDRQVPADSSLLVTPRGHILVVDDEEIVREVCREMLIKLNFEVVEADGGAEALKLMARRDFDLVLVDLQMPDMDGLQLIRHINEIPAHRRPAKIIVTGRTDSLAPEVYTELEVAGTVHKPSSLVELVEQVQVALASKDSDS